MKRIITIFSLFLSISFNAQILDYNDLGILLSNENKQGTARTMGMKNAFGALGGDLSAISINPAGTAIFTHSAAAFTLGNNKTNIQSSFYGTNTSQSNKHISLSQAGGILLFNEEEDENSSNWKKVAVAVNMNTIHDFNSSWIAKGLNQSTWAVYSNDTINYANVDSQKYSNFKEGSLTSINFSIAAQYGSSLYIGASFNAYDLEYIEDSQREEIASDDLGNSINAFESFWQEVNGEGYSFGVGVIYKPTQSIRLGLSYTTPTWYELTEESNMFEEDIEDTIGYYDLIYSDVEGNFSNNIDKIQTYEYELKTPSKTTGSIAYVFGDTGLISADLTKKDYKNIRIGTGSTFEIENNYFKDQLKDTYQLNIGTEWRYKKVSIRGGYSFEQSPYMDYIETDNISGYALGLGYNFGSFNIDLAYDYKENTDFNNFYPDITGINGVELTTKNDKILATLSLKF